MQFTKVILDDKEFHLFATPNFMFRLYDPVQDKDIGRPYGPCVGAIPLPLTDVANDIYNLAKQRGEL